MKKFHLALAVKNIEKSIADYSNRLGVKPVCIIPNEYALWRTDTLNLSIRCDPGSAETLRHLGWEDSAAVEFSSEKDINGIVWERFNEKLQVEEIENLWPEVKTRK